LSGWLVDIGLVLVLVLIGGFFAASEIALVSLREGQVQRLAGQGRRGRALGKLHADPNRFLAAVQVGVTLAGFLSAAVGGSALGDRLAPILEDLGLSQRLSSALAVVGITLVISYFSLVLGELVPKRLGLQRAESTAMAVAPTIDRIATLFRPIIVLLSFSTNVVMRLLGGDPGAGREEMSEEEVRGILASHTGLTAEERRIVSDVFVAGDTRLREVMVPRTEVAFLDAATPVANALREIVEQPHSRYPVVGEGVDDIVGFVHVRDLLDPQLSGRRVRVGELARTVMMLPGTKNILPAMSEMRRNQAHVAIVVDEYGGTAGIVTLEDLVEELVGDIRDEYDSSLASTRSLGAGVVEVDGLLNRDDFKDETGIDLPEGPYETAAGFVMASLGRVPRAGDSVTLEGYRLDVVTMDGRRVERLRVTAIPGAATPDGGAAPEASSNR
jgi:putative hemolysin